MKERMVILAQAWDGTATGSGSIQFVTPEALTFYAGGIFCGASAGGSARISYTGTAQGTAKLSTESHSGSVYKGTAAFGTCLSPGGTVMCSLRIPKDGTVQFIGTASSAGIMYVYGAFFLNESGGTSFVGGSV